MHQRRESITVLFTCPDCEESCDGKSCTCGWVNKKCKKIKGGQISASCKLCDKPGDSAYGFCKEHSGGWGAIQHSKLYDNLRWLLHGCILMEQNFKKIAVPDNWIEYQKKYRRKTAEALKKEILVHPDCEEKWEIDLRKYVILEAEVFCEVRWNKYLKVVEDEDVLDNV